MSSRDKESKPFEKLKQFFRATKGSSVNFKGKADFSLPNDIEKEIGPDAPTNQRLRAIKEYSEVVASNRLEDFAVEKLWLLVQDLLQENEKEHRHVCLYFLKCLVQGQYEKIREMRVKFFRVIKNQNKPEDIPPVLELLQVLTDNGKEIVYLEDEIGNFLLQWIPAVINVGKAADILFLFLNVIKYNAAYIDDAIVAGVVEVTCYLCSWSNKDEDVSTCLQVLDTVVCYSNLPPDSLLFFITTLCRKVNINEYTHNCWKIMRNLLGTHMGHSTLFTMCKILQDPTYYSDVGVLRGAVFYINMGLWGTKKVSSLRCTHTSVLPSILQAMECNHTIVVYEITLSIQRLVNKYGLELQDPAWDIVLSILSAITKHVEDKEPSSVTVILNKLHETLCTIEQLIELGQFNGSVRKVFSLIEMSSSVRPESSVLRLITFLAGSIVPTRYEWLTKLDSLLDKYFKQETRPNIRVKALEVLSSVISANRLIYEDELIERIVIPHLQHIDQELELSVRSAAAQILVNLCLECESKKCLELLNIFEKLLNRPYEQFGTDSPPFTSESDILDVKTIVTGLIKILTVKIHQLPSAHAIKTYKILINHLENHYHNLAVLDFNHTVHYAIFECLLKLRVNKIGHLGFAESPNTVKFSPYLIIEAKANLDRGGAGPASPPPASPAPSPYPACVVSPFTFASACKVIITALKAEKDWRIINLLLQDLPNIMQSQSLWLSKQHSNDVGLLADALCSMVSDKSLNLPESLRNLPPKLNRTEFQSYVFPVIASISSYHANLEPSLQQRCIKCLEYGLASRCASQCVMALTTCTLEMRDAMYKLLPEVLLNLSKISATVVIAIPILEFLSTLTSLPKVFASFVGDQYMSVFAIALPYTNPFKYNHYTVSLAHHVIAVWFLKCRLPFRRDFVRFITTGLKANAIAPFEEEKVMKSDISSYNEDSTSRKRSSSLTEQGSRRRERPVPNTSRMGSDLKPPMDEALLNFHKELTETCIDLMARYTFSSCSARPKRSPIAEFLLSGGQSQTWLLGHKLITVTTSGCSQKPLKNNLCDRCWMVCKADKELSSPEVDDGDREEILKLSRQNSGEKNQEEKLAVDSTSGGGTPTEEIKKDVNSEASKLEQLIFNSQNDDNKPSKDLCACWCQGWAEVYVKRPTGDMSWVMRIQNETHYQSFPLDLPVPDVTALFLPGNKTIMASLDQQPSSPPPEQTDQTTNQHTGILSISTNVAGSSPSRQNSKESVDEIYYDEEKPPEGDYSNDLRKCESNRSLNSDEGRSDPPQVYKRDRSRTISVMSPARKGRYDNEHIKSKLNSPRNKDAPRSGVSPSFVFLQLYHSAHFGSTDEKPLIISQNPAIQRAISTLDFIPPFETHKVGVIYVGPGQAQNETEILKNEFGSLRYALFLQSLGTLINLKNADPQSTFLGGLDKNGDDGKFAYIWQDDVTQVTFHVATLMPTKEKDPNCNAKKAHIGNDFVTIVYNESGEDYNIQTVKGQFNYANVIIQPLDDSTNKVVVKARDEVADLIGHGEQKIVSDQNLAILARQLALHANLASLVTRSIKAKNSDPYASNWLERLRKIKRLRQKIVQLESSEENSSDHKEFLSSPPRNKKSDYMDDFTEFT